jgi:hypothetical protein
MQRRPSVLVNASAAEILWSGRCSGQVEGEEGPLVAMEADKKTPDDFDDALNKRYMALSIFQNNANLSPSNTHALDGLAVGTRI